MNIVIVLSGLLGAILVFICCAVCVKFYYDHEKGEEGSLLKLTISVLWLLLLAFPYIAGELDVLKGVQDIISEDNILIIVQMYICTMYIIILTRIKYIGKYTQEYSKHMQLLENGKWVTRDVSYKITRRHGYVCLSIYIILLIAADVILAYILSSELGRSVVGGILVDALEKLKELGYMSYVIYAIVIIASVGLHIGLLSPFVVDGGEDRGHLEMFILEKKLASRFRDVDSEGNYYRGEKIRGFYCLSWTGWLVMNADSKNRMERHNAIMEEAGMDTFWFSKNRKYTYVLETQSGWYFTTDNGISLWEDGNVPWKEEIARSDSVVVDLIILSKKEIHYLSDSSYFARIYNQKHRRNRMPIIIENKAVSKS